MLTTAKRLPKPAQFFSANYFAEVDSDACHSCGTCLTRCQMDALSLEGGPAGIDLDRCIGCGLCVTTCPSGALRMHRKASEKPPPKDTRALYLKLFRDRYGPLKTAGILSAHLLGRKF